MTPSPARKRAADAPLLVFDAPAVSGADGSRAAGMVPPQGSADDATSPPRVPVPAAPDVPWGAFGASAGSAGGMSTAFFAALAAAILLALPRLGPRLRPALAPRPKPGFQPLLERPG
jgi:hypothetical protein